jgi:hypothetical protein
MQHGNGDAIASGTNAVPILVEAAGRSSELSAMRTFREIERLVAELAASWHASNQVLQRRRWHRVQFSKPLLITPLDADENSVDVGFVVTSRDLSVGGVSFMHERPLIYQKVAVTFPMDDCVSESVVTRLTWCRFTRQGSYLSGGQFIRGITLPPRAAETWERTLGC